SALLWNGVGHHYAGFFGWVLVFSIPPVLLAWAAPFPHDHDVAEPAQPPHAGQVLPGSVAPQDAGHRA
ncbi:hypothetical protein, partial [Roseateles saccharophilus]